MQQFINKGNEAGRNVMSTGRISIGGIVRVEAMRIVRSVTRHNRSCVSEVGDEWRGVECDEGVGMVGEDGL